MGEREGSWAVTSKLPGESNEQPVLLSLGPRCSHQPGASQLPDFILCREVGVQLWGWGCSFTWMVRRDLADEITREYGHEGSEEWAMRGWR